MATRGRKPKPTPLKLLDGTRSDRVNVREAPSIAGEPDPPKTLTGSGLEEWNRLVPMLRDMGVLSKMDATSLAIHCFTYKRWVEAEKELEESLTTTTGKGGLKASPYIQIAKDCMATMQRFLSDFGGSPSSRSRLQVEKATAPQDRLQSIITRSKRS